MKLFNTIATAALIDKALAAVTPAKAITSADYWAGVYKSRLIHRTHSSCAKGREFNAKGWDYIQPIKIQGMNDEIRDHPHEAQVIRAQYAGMLMAMSQVCPRVY